MANFLKDEDLKIDGDQVIISNERIAKSVSTDRQGAIRNFSSDVAPISDADLSIDSDGRVVVRNRQFAQKLRSLPRPLDNNFFICG